MCCFGKATFDGDIRQANILPCVATGVCLFAAKPGVCVPQPISLRMNNSRVRFSPMRVRTAWPVKA